MKNNKEEILKFIQDVVSDIVGKQINNLTEETTAEDVEGWDSLSHVQIIHRCEKKIDKKFTLEEIINLKSVADLVSVIQKYT